MAFQSIYKLLFQVSILHGYYLNKGTRLFDSLMEDERFEMLRNYEVSDFMDIVPTESTQSFMDGYRMKLVKQDGGFAVGMEVNKLNQDVLGEQAYTPFIPFDAPVSLRFNLILKERFFQNFTSLPFTAGGESLYYFSNRAGINGATYPSLSKPVPNYEANRAYSTADMVIFGGDLYEAKGNMTAAENPAFDGAQWLLLTNKPYVNSADQISLLQNTFLYAFNQPNIVDAQFTVVDFKGKEVWNQTVTAEGGNTLTEQNIPLSTLSEGTYTLNVTGTDGYADTLDFYLNNQPVVKGRFGLIEIIHEGDNSLGDYKLVDTDNDNLMIYPFSPEENRKPLYQILFKNRETVWRYIFSTDQSVTDPELGDFIRDGGADEARRFLTNSPKPLTKYPVRLQKFDIPDEPDKLLPGPSIQDIKPEPDRIYSEIRI